MKRRLLLTVSFTAFCIVAAMLCTGGAGFPSTRGVYVSTNGIVIAPSNFWQNATNLINTGNALRSDGAGTQSLQLGEAADADGAFSAAVGIASIASGFGAVAVGATTIASSNWSIAIGLGSQADNFNTMAIGHSAVATHYGSAAIGNGAATTKTNQIALGASHTVSMGLADSGQGYVLNDGASIRTNAVPVGSGSETNWLLTTIGGIPTLVATNHAAGGWLQKALFP